MLSLSRIKKGEIHFYQTGYLKTAASSSVNSNNKIYSNLDQDLVGR